MRQKTNVIKTQSLPGKSINVELVGSNFKFFGKYKLYKMEMSPSFKVKFAGEIWREEKYIFQPSIHYPSFFKKRFSFHCNSSCRAKCYPSLTNSIKFQN